MDDRQVILLTGPSRAGKTTVCRRVLTEARERGLRVAGVLTEDGEAPDGTALQLVRDLRTGALRPLAAEGAPARGGGAPAQRNGPGPRLRWSFNEEGVELGRHALEAALHEPCDLLIVDQIGPLELHHGEGWTIAPQAIAHAPCRLALVVVNPSVLDELRRRIGACEVVEVDPATRDRTPAHLIEAYLPEA